MTHQQDGLYIPDDHDRAIIARGWAVVAAIVAQLATVAGACPSRMARNGALRLLRLGEGVARRLLLAQALTRPLPAVRAFTAAVSRRLAEAARRRRWDPRDIRYKPPVARTPGFRLAEPLAQFPAPPGGGRGRVRPPPPAVTVRTYGVLTVTTRSTAGNQNLRYVEGRGLEVIDPDAEPPTPDRLVNRLEALKAVADSPARHARRMACWLARQRMKRLSAERRGRSSPLRPGRPPGACLRLAWRDAQMSMLFDAAHVARRALAAAPLARHSPDNPA